MLLTSPAERGLLPDRCAGSTVRAYGYCDDMAEIRGKYVYDDDFTPGRKIDGGLSQNLYNDEGRVETHATFIPNDEHEYESPSVLRGLIPGEVFGTVLPVPRLSKSLDVYGRLRGVNGQVFGQRVCHFCAREQRADSMSRCYSSPPTGARVSSDATA